MTRQELGRLGEDTACELLRGDGYEIIERNYHSRWGEIDIIAANGSFTAFVEVKLRAARSCVSGTEAVTPSKARKIVKTAAVWLGEHPEAAQPRFDIIQITTSAANGGSIVDALHIPDAFGAEVCDEIF